MAQPTPWLNRKQAAAYLTEAGCSVSPKTLGNLASNENSGKGPAFHRNGWSRVVYHKTDLDTWRQKRLVRVE